MKYDPEKHHRRSVRLKGYDYGQSGAYFVTIVTQDRAPLFGEIADGQMRLNDAGRMAKAVWEELPARYPGVEGDGFVVMPNHIHGVIVLVGAGPRACPERGQPQGVAPTMSLPGVVHRFKTLTTKQYVDGVKQRGWIPFLGRLWQRNYYEHVIRNEESLNQIRQYILDNPTQWTTDPENPSATAVEPEPGWAHTRVRPYVRKKPSRIAQFIAPSVKPPSRIIPGVMNHAPTLGNNHRASP